MVKAIVKNLRKVQTAAWIGKKRYVFPAGIKVRMNLTDEMVAELRRNHAFEVQIAGVVSDVEKEAKPGEIASHVVEAKPEPVPSVDTEPVMSSPVEEGKEESQEEVSGEVEEKESQKPDFFSMKKDDLASYLKEHGINAEGMSRKDMLRKVKEI